MADPAFQLNAFQNDAFQVGTQTLVQTTRFDNTNTFYAAAVTPGPVDLLPTHR